MIEERTADFRVVWYVESQLVNRRSIPAHSSFQPAYSDVAAKSNDLPNLLILEVVSSLTSAEIRIGLITNGSVVAQTTKLEGLGLTAFFNTISISEAFEFKKPDARIFTATLRELSCDPVDAWFVGDHPVNDVWGAEQVGMRGFLVPGLSWPAGYAPCGTTISSLRELLDYIELNRNAGG